ncbi:MAG: glycosidase [Planctomycetia bacterium]
MVGDDIILILRVAEAAVPEPGWVKVPVVSHRQGSAEITVETWRKERLTNVDLSDSRHFILDGTRYLSSLSHFRVARSRDGIHFEVETAPFMIPETPSETYGIEDPRAVWIGDRCYITCTAAFEDGFGVLLSSTADFKRVERHGFIFPPENKNCCLFPEKVGNKYIALHRPIVKDFGKPCVWYAESPDLFHWGNASCLMRPSGLFQNRKIGSGPGPIKTDEGWLYLYHGVDDNEVYRLFLAVLDADDPRKVRYNKTLPLLEPEMSWEKEGFVPNVVFSNGWVRKSDDTFIVYYGGADTAVGVAAASLRELLDWVIG